MNRDMNTMLLYGSVAAVAVGLYFLLAKPKIPISQVDAERIAQDDFRVFTGDGIILGVQSRQHTGKPLLVSDSEWAATGAALTSTSWYVEILHTYPETSGSQFYMTIQVAALSGSVLFRWSKSLGDMFGA